MLAYPRADPMQPALHLHPGDPVAVALVPIAVGDVVLGVTARADIPAGHKIALTAVAPGVSIAKFGQPIGIATAAIRPGDHVHTHNLGYAAGTPPMAVRPAMSPRQARPLHFQGYARADGRVGTRNVIGILTSVNCAATVARRIEAHFSPERLAGFPRVNDVQAFVHQSGCGMAHRGDGIDNLRRVIAGMATHPNFAAVLLIGLGCEVNQTVEVLAAHGLAETETLRVLHIQEAGGTSAAVRAGIAAVEAMLPAANAWERMPAPVSALTIGLQCGGSDGYSALSANPALGVAVDLLVASGGTAILSETPEIHGAEHLLTARARTMAVADALMARIHWWEEHATANGADLNNNPSPGNIAGGITTILEKSLGAVAKSGTAPLNAVLRYAERVDTSGFVFMDTPGYDPASATGQIAGGANLIVFTTGRGSVFGSRPAPTLKLSSNSMLAARMPDDIDLDCGRLLSGEATLEELGGEVFAAMLSVASGEPTRSEIEGLGAEEFVPWTPGAAM